METCDGDDCYYRNNSSYTMEDVTRCVVNAYEEHVLALKGKPEIVDLCDMCIRKYVTDECAMCGYEMIDDSIVLAGEPICAYCIKDLRLESSPDPEKLKKFFESVPVDGEARQDCICCGFEICEEEIKGLQKWICDEIKMNKQREEKEKKRAKELQNLATAHLVKRGYTEWESHKLVNRLGREVRYIGHRKIAKLLLEKMGD